MESIKELQISTFGSVKPGSPKKPDTPKRKQLKRMLKKSKLADDNPTSPALKAIETSIVLKHSDSDDFLLTI
ncbi:MAG: hypothetical protein CXT73_04895 [Methanobacteriota archaeon]|nr:MAG: hypothetical protein CXT73_04895 [Euryarchaeota archaeon]